MAEVVSRDVFDERMNRVFNWRADPSKLAAIEDWIYDPARRVNEATVFETPGGALAVVVVLATQAPKQKTFEQVQDVVAKHIKSIRQGRVEFQHFLDLLQHATIWPASLAAQLEADARRILKQFDSDPRAKDIRLR
jgi:hypothetical protein